MTACEFYGNKISFTHFSDTLHILVWRQPKGKMWVSERQHPPFSWQSFSSFYHRYTCFLILLLLNPTRYTTHGFSPFPCPFSSFSYHRYTKTPISSSSSYDTRGTLLMTSSSSHNTRHSFSKQQVHVFLFIIPKINKTCCSFYKK